MLNSAQKKQNLQLSAFVPGPPPPPSPPRPRGQCARGGAREQETRERVGYQRGGGDGRGWSGRREKRFLSFILCLRVLGMVGGVGGVEWRVVVHATPRVSSSQKFSKKRKRTSYSDFLCSEFTRALKVSEISPRFGVRGIRGSWAGNSPRGCI